MFDLLYQISNILSPYKIIFLSAHAKQCFHRVRWSERKEVGKDLEKKIRIDVVPHPSRIWWNRKAKKYGNMTGKQKLIEILKMRNLLQLDYFLRNLPEDPNISGMTLVEQIAKQYENQGLSFLELVEIGNIASKKAEMRQGPSLKEEKKLSQKVWFIRQEILNEIEKQKAANKS